MTNTAQSVGCAGCPVTSVRGYRLCGRNTAPNEKIGDGNSFGVVEPVGAVFHLYCRQTLQPRIDHWNRKVCKFRIKNP